MVVRVSSPRARRVSTSGRVLGILALCAAGTAAAFLLGRGSAPTLVPERQRAYIPEFNVVEVPVPNIPVAAGTLVRDIPIRMERFPSHQLPREVVRDVSVVRNSVALVALPGGLPMVATNLGSPDELSNPIVGRIPPGMRAMTVRVDATAAVEGWARSGSIIDVLLVEQTRTTVVAEQVKVISAERSLSPGAEDASMPIPSTVTLLVTQEQCLAINTAVGLGKIAFALRSARDPEGWRTTQFSAAALSDDRSTKSPARVSGVVAVGSGATRRRYALVDGAWIPTEQVPTGFLLGEESDANGGQHGEE